LIVFFIIYTNDARSIKYQMFNIASNMSM